MGTKTNFFRTSARTSDFSLLANGISFYVRILLSYSLVYVPELDLGFSFSYSRFIHFGFLFIFPTRGTAGFCCEFLFSNSESKLHWCDALILRSAMGAQIIPVR